MEHLIQKLKTIEHGFSHILDAGNAILADRSLKHLHLATTFLEDDSYQLRMLAVHMLGQLAPRDQRAFEILETKVPADENWRVQEMLAKAFDHYCKTMGYEKALPLIKKWLAHPDPNVKRAVTEGLRVWTKRPYFKDHPDVAIRLIAQSGSDESEYLRKSVGNALRDIRKTHGSLVDREISNWDLTNKNILFTHRLVYK